MDSPRILCTVLTSLLVVSWGCGTQQQSKPVEESHIKVLAINYGIMMGQQRGRPPRSEADFKKFLETKVDNVDELLISERDGQPYVIFYGKLGPRLEAVGGPVTMYEQAGVGGKRFVASELATIEEVDEAQIRAVER